MTLVITKRHPAKRNKAQQNDKHTFSALNHTRGINYYCETCMGFIRYVICFLLCLPSLNTIATTFEDLEYITEQYAPYNYQDDSGVPQGLAVEVLNKVWEVLDITPKTLKVFPWARGYSIALHKNNTLLFSTTRSLSRENLFKWACPIIDIRVVLIALKSNNIHIGSMEEAKQFNIVAIKSDIGHQLLLDNGFKEDKIYLSNFLDSALKMVKHGRVDLISSAEITAYQQLREMEEVPKDYDIAWVLETNPLCFAFHHDVDDSLIERFQKALDQVNKIPGFMQKLKEKYHLSAH